MRGQVQIQMRARDVVASFSSHDCCVPYNYDIKRLLHGCCSDRMARALEFPAPSVNDAVVTLVCADVFIGSPSGLRVRPQHIYRDALSSWSRRRVAARRIALRCPSVHHCEQCNKNNKIMITWHFAVARREICGARRWLIGEQRNIVQKYYMVI